MCKKRKDVLATNPETRSRSSMISSISGGSMAPLSAEWSSESAVNGAREAARLSSFKPSSSSSSDRLSIAGIRDILPETPNIYEFSEIFSATRSPQARRLSSPSSYSWRCRVRGKDVVVFQRRFLGDPSEFRRRVVASSGVHHKNIIRLLGAALGGDDIFLVWFDRMLIAADIAQGLQYIHHFTASGAAPPPSRSDGGQRCPVHDRIKSSSIMITEVDRRAKIGHFGAVELARGTHEFDSNGDKTEKAIAPPQMRRSGSGKVKLEGARGYIAPEVRHGGSASQKSDVYAFGVVLLELLTGEEPVKYTYNSEIKGYEMISLTESARNLMAIEVPEQELDGKMDSFGDDHLTPERNQRIRSWIDRRLKDSFPEEVAERAVRVALECVHPQAEKRPTMVRVAAKLSALLMQSKTWAEKMNFPEEVTVSLAPR